MSSCLVLSLLHPLALVPFLDLRLPGLPSHLSRVLTALTLQLIDENGMEVFTKYFTKLVHTSASQIFPGTSRPIGSATNTGGYSLLLEEMRKISHDVDQATKISESIETGTEDIFRDFDLSTFMEHFRLDALEKTILALAFKLGSRPDLKAKGTPVSRDWGGQSGSSDGSGRLTENL